MVPKKLVRRTEGPVMGGQRVWRMLALVALVAMLSEFNPQRLGHAAASGKPPAREPPGQQQQQPTPTPTPTGSRANYFGSFMGKLADRDGHSVSGDVYAVDEQTLFIRNFSYDGLAPDAYFWSAPLDSAGLHEGFIVPDEKGSTKPLERYVEKDVVLRLPEGRTLREIRWLSVWSRQLRRSVADLALPSAAGGQTFVIPRPLEVGALSQLAHGLSSGPITIVDAQTFLVPDFHYDGLAPDAYFWLTRGPSGLAGHNSLRLKDENGSTAPLRKYQGETVVISLPDELTIYDFDFFGVWCRQFGANFGQVRIPQMARVPPSPKMLGIKPENKLNCEILYDELGFEIRWVLDGDDIVMQLVGKIEPGEYMAFGLGKDDSRSDMENADAVVAWVERATGQVHALDYFLGAKQQCRPAEAGATAAPQGSCPDLRLPGGTDSLTLLHGAIVNGYSMVTFKRPQLGVDEKLDQHVYSDGQQSVIWAIGALNAHKEPAHHRLHTQANMFIDFARNPQWNCPIPDLNASMHNSLPVVPSASQLDQTVVSASEAPAPGAPGASQEPETATRQQQQPAEQQTGAWFIPQVVCPSDRTFYAQIGPTAGRRGYAGLTGRAGWTPAASWYINGLMIPELVVERGQTYRFVVEGGNDKLSPVHRHPLYLTDAPDGGFNFKTDDERQRERLYGGVAQRASDGQLVPTAEGRLCEWRPTNATLANPDAYATFSAYQRSLKLHCQPGQPAILKFAPDAATPDLIYYQCYTNRLMGWKIHVVDSCTAYLSALDKQHQASRTSAAGNISWLEEEEEEEEDEEEDNKREGGSQQNTSAEEGSPMMARKKKKKKRNKEGVAKSPDRVERRQLADFDLKAQQSEQRMLAYELAPKLAHQHQQASSNLITDDDLLASTSPATLNFGDELAASDDQLWQNNYNQSGLLAQHQQQLFSASLHAALNNATAIEQILKMSPADLEFLDDSQLDLMSALALAAASNPGQFQPAGGQPAQPTGAPPSAPKNSTIRAKLSGARTPKGLQGYMSRLASLYYPVQQQLFSMLAPTAAPAASADQQQAAALASLHQQIVAAASTVPGQAGQAQWKQAAKSAGAEQAGPAPAASSASFSLASLVPMPKFDLSKSNLGKKFGKFRIKSGRKYEPNQSAGSAANGQAAKRPARPPTPDNEFNYDIFNNQLAQLEHQQRQLQSMESFAAAAAGALVANNQQQQDGAGWAFANYAPPDAGLMMAGQRQPSSPQQTSATSMSQAQLEQQDALLFSSTSHMFDHQNDPLQQQQSLLSNQRQPTAAGQPHHQAQQQQAVFITKLAPSFQMLASSGVHEPRWQQQPAQLMPSGPADRARPSYLDSTDYSAAPHPSGPGAEQSGQQRPRDESLNGGESSHQQEVAKANLTAGQQQQQPGASSAGSEPDLDHMLAIERYSKQSSERRPPSIVHPITGELVNGHALQQTTGELERPGMTGDYYATEAAPLRTSNGSQPKRYSSMLIDKHIVAPSNAISELLEAEPSGQDLKRLNASEQRQNIVVTSQAQVTAELAGPPQQAARYSSTTSTTTSEPVLLRPSFSPAAPGTPATIDSLVDFFTPEPTTRATTAGLVITGSTAGPLVPSLGPPVARPAGEQLVFKSNLIEPIKSTLVATNELDSGAPMAQQHQQHTFGRPPSYKLDASPFTPLELFAGEQAASPNSLQFRMRPPPLIESMLSQYQLPHRPEPPVQLALYLSQQLASRRQQPASEARSSSQQTSQTATSSNSVNTTSRTAAALRSPGLILLKPAPVANVAQPHTYALRPEYLAGSSAAAAERAQSRPAGDGQPEVSEHQAAASSRLALAGRQFERLSSLSSPPSTSMQLSSPAGDPMQAANSIQTYNFQLTDHMAPRFSLPIAMDKPAERQRVLVPFENKPHIANQPAKDAAPPARANSSRAGASGEQPAGEQRPPPLDRPTQPASSDDAGSLAGLLVGSQLMSDNSTDNAILSHVMSLISANAIPAPMPSPAYSSADYFLPINPLESHQQGASLRGRSIRS